MALSREEIASRYSKALFAYAQDAKKLDEVHEDMNVLLQVAKENPDMLRLLSAPIIRKNQKEDFLSSFSGEFSSETKNFLDFLLEYGRFNALTEIINAFDALYDEDKNIASGTAVSAINLDEDELNRISQAYAKKYGFKKLVLTNEVDSSILGGIILKVGDRIIDGSIRTRLQQIREQLIENR